MRRHLGWDGVEQRYADLISICLTSGVVETLGDGRLNDGIIVQLQTPKMESGKITKLMPRTGLSKLPQRTCGRPRY